MKQLVLFDDYGHVMTLEQKGNMTWLELYNFLESEKIKNPKFLNETILVHDLETGDEHPCDMIIFDDTNKLVLSINNL
jgi:hypothetical protein